MSNALESALLIDLSGTIDWSAALPPINHVTGTLTTVNPGLPLDITQYARRDREFQHRDVIAAAAVAKVSVFARTVWNGSVVQPLLQGFNQVADPSGTNVRMPLDPSQIGTVLPNGNTAVHYVLNASIPYDAIRVTDVNLYNRDLLLYETLARAASIFPGTPPILQIDPLGIYIGSTSVWATAQGTNTPKVPNAAEPMSQATFKEPDLYLSERDNQVAAYVSRVCQALQNPFEYASRVYVRVDSTIQSDTEESETYVLTDNVFTAGNTYTAGDQVLHNDVWYQAVVTTTDTPPSANWTPLSKPTQLQFLADPSLDSRNRLIYDKIAKTLQWFRESLDLVHIPQIVGFLIPGILPQQDIETIPAIPERKDAQFYRQKASRLQFATGTYSTQQVFAPTGNRDTASTHVSGGGFNTLFENQKDQTLAIPDNFTLNFQDIFCSSGTYALDCLVRPSPSFVVAGGDNDQGSLTSDGGTTFSAIGDVRNWEISLPAGGWKLFIEFSNVSASQTSFFGIKATQGATSILANTLPIYYTDADGNALPQNTPVTSPGIDIQSTGQTYNFSVTWTTGSGQLHISQLRFEQVNGPDTSHYIMAASWLNSVDSNPTQVQIAGGDAQGVTPTGDGGVDFPGQNSLLNWDISLTPGNWQLFIVYSNSSSSTATQFGITATLPGLSNQPFVLPYTDSSNTPLPQDTLVTSAAIGVPSDGSDFTLGIKWTSADGTFHIKTLLFVLSSSTDSISSLDVIGQANVADVMPFRFFLAGTDAAPEISVTWLPKSANVWQARAYNPGDQVLFNLIYWQATALTTASDIPGQSGKWSQLGLEPQIPLIFEQIQLSKLVATSPTPDAVGFQGFRQDMAERALRSDQDAYTQALSQVGTNFPEFRDGNDSWVLTSTGSWMSFMEVYQPRLRQVDSIPSGNIVAGRQYIIRIANGTVGYNGVSYNDGQKFYGVTGVFTYTTNGTATVNQVGAYRISHPGDIGKIGLIPAGIEYVRMVGTGTVHGWYPSYASYPTHQAIQPWMIEQRFYAADNDFQSPDGNLIPPGSPDNATVAGGTPEIDTTDLTFDVITNAWQVPGDASFGNTIYQFVGINGTPPYTFSFDDIGDLPLDSTLGSSGILDVPDALPQGKYGFVARITDSLGKTSTLPCQVRSFPV